MLYSQMKCPWQQQAAYDRTETGKTIRKTRQALSYKKVNGGPGIWGFRHTSFLPTLVLKIGHA